MQVQNVWPEKIYGKPGEAVSMEVVVANPDKEAASASSSSSSSTTLTRPSRSRRRMSRSSRARRPSGRKSGRPRNFSAWSSATLLRGGSRIARKSEYFTCAPSVHQVLMWGRGNHGGMQFPGTIDDTADQYAAEFSQQWMLQYGNFFDQFGWGPSDFDCLTPKEDRWWAGQTSYNESKTNTNKVYAAFRAHGIRYVTYGKAAGGGPVTFELLRRRPEMAGYTDGRPWLENYTRRLPGLHAGPWPAQAWRDEVRARHAGGDGEGRLTWMEYAGLIRREAEIVRHTAAITRRTRSIAPGTTPTTFSSTWRFAATSWAGIRGRCSSRRTSTASEHGLPPCCGTAACTRGRRRKRTCR